MTVILILAVVAIMIFFNALYVAAEFATVSSRRTRIDQMAGSGNRMAQILSPIVNDSKKLDAYVATCQIGITLSSLVLGAYGQNVIAQWLTGPLNNLIIFSLPLLTRLGLDTSQASGVLAHSAAVLIVLAFITTLQVIFGELFPKSVAIQYPEKMALAVVTPMRISQALFWPLTLLFNGSGRLLLRLMGKDFVGEAAHAHSPEEIELLVTESHHHQKLTTEERLLLRNAFRLRELTARQVMLHRTKLVAAPENSTVTDIIDLSLEHGLSRIPIYRETIDDIVGFVHIKDIFRLYINKETDPCQVLRDALYVPETMPVNELWEKLNAGGQYIAIVFDEYGGTAGLITLEDLIEEVFGELQDEFDDEMALISRDKDGRIYLRGDLLVADVNEYLELDLPENHDTLSGLVISELERKPKVGDEIEIGKVNIRIESLADPGVSEISLLLPPQEQENEGVFIEWELGEHD